MTDATPTSATAHAQVAAEFAERFDLLEESGQVTNLARRLTEMCLADLATDLGLTLTEDNAAQFVTHLAIALTRINRGDPEIASSVVAAEEIADRTREHEAVTRVMRDASRLLQREVPESELTFMTVHLCGLVDDKAASGS